MAWKEIRIMDQRLQFLSSYQKEEMSVADLCRAYGISRPTAYRWINFRYVFNNERPHEGLNNQVPASLYISSSIRLPRKLPEFTYPMGLLLRRVNNSATSVGTRTES
jgi:hypothetical protein